MLYDFAELTEQDLARLWVRIPAGAPDACWLWQGRVQVDGYGQLACRRRWMRVHRIVCFLTYGIPPKLSPYAIHSCDQPLCCNPRHLRWGSHKDNGADMVIRNRCDRRPAAVRRWSPTFKALLFDRYRQKKSLTLLAREFGVDRASIRRALVRAGLRGSPKGESVVRASYKATHGRERRDGCEE